MTTDVSVWCHDSRHADATCESRRAEDSAGRSFLPARPRARWRLEPRRIASRTARTSTGHVLIGRSASRHQPRGGKEGRRKAHKNIMPYRPIYLWEITVKTCSQLLHPRSGTPAHTAGQRPPDQGTVGGQSPAVGTCEGWGDFRVTSYGVCGHLLATPSLPGTTLTLLLKNLNKRILDDFMGLCFFRRIRLRRKEGVTRIT